MALPSRLPFFWRHVTRNATVPTKKRNLLDLPPTTNLASSFESTRVDVLTHDNNSVHLNSLELPRSFDEENDLHHMFKGRPSNMSRWTLAVSSGIFEGYLVVCPAGHPWPEIFLVPTKIYSGVFVTDLFLPNAAPPCLRRPPPRCSNRV
jgi:hypothetical protein